MIKLAVDKTIGLKIKSDANAASNEFSVLSNRVNILSANLKKAGFQVKNIKQLASETGNYTKATITATKGTTTLTQTVDKFGKTINKLSVNKATQNISKLKEAFGSIISLGKLYALWNVTKRVRDAFSNMVSNAIDFVETSNKFNVSMEDMADEGTKFVNKVSEKFGLAKEEIMNFQSSYNNIMKGLGGVTKETAYGISESLTKMAIDYASLYNVSTESSMEKFQAALVGSVRPIRTDSGYDITETTIGEKAKDLGVETPVRGLNQMEKRLLRIIVLMEQMQKTGAMSDFARTIEQPANQLKILQNQLKELGMWLGNVFISTIGKIMPYINGFVMALKEVAKAIAIFVGYKDETGSGPLGDTSDDINDIDSGLGSATSKAKELKKILMGFDVLNVIQTPSSSSSGGGSSIEGVDPKILGALKEYDNLMDSVKMKATSIRDKIMEWLGYTKHVNMLTGETYFTLDNTNSRAAKIWEWVKKIAYAIAGIALIKKILKIYKAFKELKNLGLFNVLINGASSFAAGLSIVGSNIISVYRSTGSLGTAFMRTANDLHLLLTPLQKVITVIAGVVANFLLMKDLFADLASGADVSAGKIIGFAAAVGAIAVAVGLLTGPIGAIVVAAAAIIGVIAGIVDGLNEARVAAAESMLFDGQGLKTDDVVEALRNSTDAITENATSLNNLKETYTNWKDTADTTTQSLDILLAQFGSKNFSVGQEQIEKMTKAMDDLEESVLSTSQAFTDYIIGSITNLKEEGVVSKETADKVVDAAIRKQQAEGKYFEAYKTKLQDLNKQLKDGTISQEKYAEEVAKAKKAYNDATTDSTKLKDSLQLLTSKMQAKIDLQNWEEVEKLIGDINDLYDEQKAKIDESYDTQYLYYSQLIDFYDKEIKDQQEILGNLDKQSEKYKIEEQRLKTLQEEQLALKEAQDATTIEYQQNITKLGTEATPILMGISQQIKDANAEITEEGRNSLDTLNQTMDKVSSDMMSSTNMATTAYNQMVQNIEKNNPETSLEVKMPTVQDLNDNYKNKKLTINGLIKASSVTLPKSLQSLLGITATGVKYYAKGGLPDVGEMFVAREAGPELVGSIGNRTTVMNNDQIVESVSRGVAQAVSSVMGNVGSSNIKLYIDGQEITNVVTQRQNRMANITGMGW